jgi:ubiquinone/menaquinone biosynthesis C-methylase UbiE
MWSWVHGSLDSATWFHLVRSHVYVGTTPRLAACLDPRPDERIIDVGCGTGLCAGLVNGHYVGIDTNVPYLRLARRHARGHTNHVAKMSGAALGFRDGAFDKAMLISIVHHLDDEAVDSLLNSLRRVVRGAVVVLDLAAEYGNWLERWFVRHDRGHHVRPVPAMRSLLTRHYRLTHEEIFHNTARTVAQVMFRLVPP